MASPVDVIYKVNEFLYSRQTPMTFRECQNCLVDRHILSEQEADHHHKEIRSRYLEWKTGFEARHGGNQQPQPAGPPTPESPAPHAAPSNISPSSPPGGARGATILHGLKEALERIDPEVSRRLPLLLMMHDELLLTFEGVATDGARRHHSLLAWRPKPSVKTSEQEGNLGCPELHPSSNTGKARARKRQTHNQPPVAESASHSWSRRMCPGHLFRRSRRDTGQGGGLFF